MIDPNFVLLGIFINFLGGLNYIIDTLKGKVKPNRVTWFLWALVSFIAFAAEIKQGVGIQSLMTFMVGFTPLLIFIASFFNKKAYWKISRFDLLCGALSLLGLLLWYMTKVGNIAIFFSIISDLTAGIPTLVKAYKYPETENYIEFSSSMISSILTVLTFTSWTFALYAFPLYIFFFDTIMIVLIKFKLGRRLSYSKHA